MVQRPSAWIPAHVKHLPQCAALAVYHRLIPRCHASQRIFSITHLAHRLQHIPLHIRTGELSGCQHVKQQRILFLSCHAGQYGKGLYSVVGLTGELWVLIGISVPQRLVNSGFKSSVHLSRPLGLAGLAQQVALLRVVFQRYRIPHLAHGLHVLVLAPVAPVPRAFAILHKAVGGDAPLMHIPLVGRVHRAQRLLVSTAQIVVPRSQTHHSKGLHRQLLFPVALGHRRIHHAIGTLPCGQFQQALAGQSRGRWRQGIERLHQLVGHIAYPLCPLAVGAVHIVVAHGHIQRALRLLPQRVQSLIIALEFSA